MDITKITKEQFLAAYNKFPPSKWVKFTFKYFSRDAKDEDTWMKKSLTYLLVLLFLLGFVGTAFGWARMVIMLPTLGLTFILVCIGIIMGSGAILNNLRIRKIRKELGGVSKLDYNILAGLHY